MGTSFSCDCSGDFAWFYSRTKDAPVPLATTYSRKCCSCGCRIKPGDLAECVPRWRPPSSHVDESIHGDEVPLSPWYLCPYCAGLGNLLDKYGVCVCLGNDFESQLVEALNSGVYLDEWGVWRGIFEDFLGELLVCLFKSHEVF